MPRGKENFENKMVVMRKMSRPVQVRGNGEQRPGKQEKSPNEKTAAGSEESKPSERGEPRENAWHEPKKRSEAKSPQCASRRVAVRDVHPETGPRSKREKPA